MMTLDAVRAAVLSDLPWSRLDELVRAEMALGRKTKQIYDDLIGLADEIDDTPGLSEDGSDAFGDTLDALTGMCHPDCQYYDPPNTTLPSEEEIAALPRWARVAFVVRCAHRALPLFQKRWPQAPAELVRELAWAVEIGEATSAHAGTGEKWATPAGAITCANYVCDAVLNAGRDLNRTLEVTNALRRAISKFKDIREDAADTIIGIIVSNASIAIANGLANSPETYRIAQPTVNLVIRRDFDHLANLAQWQHYTDDTPVPPEVFGPLWPEGPPAGWPADPDVPQRAELPLALVSAARALERMTEDEVVNLFNAVNAYYVARTGDRLTIEDLRPLLAAGVFAGV